MRRITAVVAIIFSLLAASLSVSLFVPKTRAGEVWPLDYEGNWCLSFDGLNNSVNCGASQIYDLYQFTVEAWVKPKYNVNVGSNTAYGHQDGTIVEHRPTYNPYYSQPFFGWWVGFSYLDGSLHLSFGYLSGGLLYVASYHTNKGNWYNDTWYHVAVTYNPDLPNQNIKFYVNGVFDSSHDIEKSINYIRNSNVANYYLQVGKETGGSQYGGSLDELRILNYSRSQSEIQSTWNRTLSAAEVLNPALVGCWSFDDANYTRAHGLPDPTSTIDSSTQGNDGILGSIVPTPSTAPIWIRDPTCPIIPEYTQPTVIVALVTGSIVSLGLFRKRLRKAGASSEQ